MDDIPDKPNTKKCLAFSGSLILFRAGAGSLGLAAKRVGGVLKKDRVGMNQKAEVKTGEYLRAYRAFIFHLMPTAAHENTIVPI